MRAWGVRLCRRGRGHPACRGLGRVRGARLRRGGSGARRTGMGRAAGRGAGVGIRCAGGLGRRLAPAFSVRVAAPSCSRGAWRPPRCQNERVLRRVSAFSERPGCGRVITCQVRGSSPAIILIRGPAKLVRFDSGRGSAATATAARRLAAPTANAPVARPATTGRPPVFAVVRVVNRSVSAPQQGCLILL